jgi:Na+(H+)/acetate symporter ActP
MSFDAAIGLLIVLALTGANLPFLNERLFVLGPRRLPRKSIGWRLLELSVYGVAVVLIGRLIEGRLGQVSSQAWEFYAVMLCLMLTFAAPGFIWALLRRRHD